MEKGTSELYYVSCEPKQEPLCRSHFDEILLILYQYATHPDRRQCFKDRPTLLGPFDKREMEIVRQFRQITLDSIL